jgi:hypothetical protein
MHMLLTSLFIYVDVKRVLFCTMLLHLAPGGRSPVWTESVTIRDAQLPCAFTSPPEFTARAEYLFLGLCFVKFLYAPTDILHEIFTMPPAEIILVSVQFKGSHNF